MTIDEEGKDDQLSTANKDRKRRMKYYTIIGEKARIIDVMINGNKNKKEKNDP